MSMIHSAYSLFITSAALFFIVVGFGVAGYPPIHLYWYNGKGPSPDVQPARRIPKEERTQSRFSVIVSSPLFWLSLALMAFSRLLMYVYN